MFVLETTPAHDHPAGPAIRQEQAMLAFESAIGGAGLVISLLSRSARSSGWMRERIQSQVSGTLGGKPINGPTFVAHPRLVAIRIKTPEGEIG